MKQNNNKPAIIVLDGSIFECEEKFQAFQESQLDNRITDKMIITAIKAKALADQKAIRYESDEDEGAAEHHAELQSVIDAVDEVLADEFGDAQDVYDACENVGFSIKAIVEAV